MLIEEQATELLQRCEALLGKELRQIRGDLRNDSTRAAAVWELIVIEAAANIGSIEHEPLPGSSPDIRLHLPHGRTIWIEATYLYPRFWQRERQSEAVLRWLFSETKLRGISSGKIFIRLDGEQKPAGRIRKLPRLHEKNKLLNEPELISFYSHIASNPHDSHFCHIAPYTISIFYNPGDEGPHHSSGGLVQEAPISVREHAVYRKLKEKVKQHNVREPLVVCIGSDQSHALSRLQSHPSFNDAVDAAFLKYHSLAAVIVVAIELKPAILEGVKRHVRGDLFINANAINPLTLDEVNSLSAMNFNRWKYVSPLPKFESSSTKRLCRVTGTFTWIPKAMGLEIEIPANIVVDALAGKTSLTKAYNLTKEHMLSRALSDGWVVKSCQLIEGKIEAGEAPKIVLELIPPLVATFWTKKSKVPDDA